MVTKSLKKYLDVFLYDRNTVGSSLEIFSYLKFKKGLNPGQPFLLGNPFLEEGWPGLS